MQKAETSASDYFGNIDIGGPNVPSDDALAMGRRTHRRFR
jgi:hypothetical protein